MRDAFVTVFQRGGQLVLLPSGRTTAGLRIPIEPVSLIPLESSDELRPQLERALSVSAETVVQQPDWKLFRPPSFAAVGAKNEQQFFKGVRTVTVQRHPQRGFIVSPMKRSGRYNLIPDTEAVVNMGEVDIAQVVETVLILLQSADEHP